MANHSFPALSLGLFFLYPALVPTWPGSGLFLTRLSISVHQSVYDIVSCFYLRPNLVWAVRKSINRASCMCRGVGAGAGARGRPSHGRRNYSQHGPDRADRNSTGRDAANTFEDSQRTALYSPETRTATATASPHRRTTAPPHHGSVKQGDCEAQGHEDPAQGCCSIRLEVLV